MHGHVNVKKTNEVTLFYNKPKVQFTSISNQLGQNLKQLLRLRRTRHFSTEISKFASSLIVNITKIANRNYDLLSLSDYRNPPYLATYPSNWRPF
jgi:hypothetical protein